MKRLEEAAIVLGFPAATGQAGPEHRKRVRPIVLIHLCRHRPRPLIRSVSYKSCPIPLRNPKKRHLSKIRPHGLVNASTFTRVFLLLERRRTLGDVAPNREGALMRSAAEVSSGGFGIRDVEEVHDLIVNRQKPLCLPG